MTLTQTVSEAVSYRTRVLVVEDDLFIRMDVADELRAAGFVVIEAASGDDAATVLESGELFNVLFTDVQLPGVLNGLSLARVVSAKCPDIPIIVTSGNDEFRKDALAFGTFVPKPYDSRRIVKLIDGVLSDRA